MDTWYDEHVEGFVHIALNIEEDYAFVRPTDRRMAEELHEYLSAPDSFMVTWKGDESDQELALQMLDQSDHPQIAGPFEVVDGEVNYIYYAANAFIADVLVRLGRDPRAAV